MASPAAPTTSPTASGNDVGVPQQQQQQQHQSANGRRLFVVCGKHVPDAVLRQAFEAYGAVENFKVLRDKGVAYVRYDSAENAKAAMEGLDGVCLQDAKLKVMVADERGPRPPVGGSSGGVAVGGASASGCYAAICDQNPLHHHHHHPRDTVGEGLRESPTTDPDNFPPRSRLFIVCPRNADPVKIQEAAKEMEDMEYCKTDLIAGKGVMFIKFSRMSSALRALEDIVSAGTLAGYQVKCMIAEPKGKRERDHSAEGGLPSPAQQAARLDYGMNSMHLDHSGVSYARQQPYHSQSRAPGAGGVLSAGGAGFELQLDSARAAGARRAAGLGVGLHYAPSGAPAGPRTGGTLLGGWSAVGNLTMGQLHDLQLQDYCGVDLTSVVGGLGLSDTVGRHISSASATTRPLYAHDHGLAPSLSGGLLGAGVRQHEQQQHLLLGLPHSQQHRRPIGGPGLAVGGASFPAGPSHASSAPLPTNAGALDMQQRGAVYPQRLFVVVNKSVTVDSLARLFKRFPGMEYCDLKKELATGKSKGYAYVNYSTPQAAAAAVEQLHGSEFPPGQRIKVMFAEPLGSRTGGRAGSHKAALEAEGSSDSRASAHSRSRVVEDAGTLRGNNAEVVSGKKKPPPELNRIQDSFSALRTSPDGEGASEGHIDPAAVNKRHTGEGEKQAREGSVPLRGWGAMAQHAASSDSPQGQVYTFLEKPLPDYAIKHVFSSHGEIVSVTVHADDPRYGLIRYANMESAIQALQALDGTDLFGIPLSVMASDPLQASRTPKRARVAQ